MAETQLGPSTTSLVRWRRRQLDESGFPPHLARRVAGDSRLDLHALIELVEQGCPPDLAIRILEPLDSSP